MNKNITKATDTTLNLYNSIDDYKFDADVRIKFEALGQCLRSLKEMLHDERQDTTA